MFLFPNYHLQGKARTTKVPKRDFHDLAITSLSASPSNLCGLLPTLNSLIKLGYFQALRYFLPSWPIHLLQVIKRIVRRVFRRKYFSQMQVDQLGNLIKTIICFFFKATITTGDFRNWLLCKVILFPLNIFLPGPTPQECWDLISTFVFHEFLIHFLHYFSDIKS